MTKMETMDSQSKRINFGCWLHLTMLQNLLSWGILFWLCRTCHNNFISPSVHGVIMVCRYKENWRMMCCWPWYVCDEAGGYNYKVKFWWPGSLGKLPFRKSTLGWCQNFSPNISTWRRHAETLTTITEANAHTTITVYMAKKNTFHHDTAKYQQSITALHILEQYLQPHQATQGCWCHHLVDTSSSCVWEWLQKKNQAKLAAIEMIWKQTCLARQDKHIAATHTHTHTHTHKVQALTHKLHIHHPTSTYKYALTACILYIVSTNTHKTQGSILTVLFLPRICEWETEMKWVRSRHRFQVTKKPSPCPQKIQCWCFSTF